MQLTDQKIVEQIIEAQDTEAFRFLVEKYQVGLVRYCYSIVLDEDIANDIAQQAMICAYEKLNSYKPKYSFSTWLYRIARNEAFREIKRLYKQSEFSEVNDVAETDISEAIDRKHVAEDVRRALLSLRTEWRQILHFYYWENRTYEEIAEIMDKPINTIKVWMSRAKQQLEKELQPI